MNKGLERTMALILLASTCNSCAPAYREEQQQPFSRRWTGQTMYYEGEVREDYTPQGQCVNREVTLRAPNKLNPPGVISYVKAVDRECNFSIDEYRFRDRFEASRIDRNRLDMDILDAVYTIRYAARQ